MILLIGAGLLVVLLAVCDRQLRHMLVTTPKLPMGAALAPNAAPDSSLAVVIPVYNEAENLADCLTAVLDNTDLSAAQMQVWVVDDQSTDETWAIAQAFQQARSDPRLHLLSGTARPVGEIWVGKNWACVQAIEQLQPDNAPDFLLFMDADVRLGRGAIAAALIEAQQSRADLLSCAPALQCACLAEWLVQPIMLALLVLGFDNEAVNDPQSKTAFAAGPFMLFRNTAYAQIGGHRGVADQVVEDVELARRVKFSGLRLRFISGVEAVSVRMYRSWGALWEGWTKNLYAGSQRNLGATLGLAGLVGLLCVAPWVTFGAILLTGFWGGWSGVDGISLGLVAIALGLQYDVRRVVGADSKLPPRYWWLTGVGGVLVMAIALASIFKTETGIGWTWRGRSLKPMPPLEAK